MSGMAVADRLLDFCPLCGKRQLMVGPGLRRCLACKWKSNGRGERIG